MIKQQRETLFLFRTVAHTGCFLCNTFTQAFCGVFVKCNIKDKLSLTEVVFLVVVPKEILRTMIKLKDTPLCFKNILLKKTADQMIHLVVLL